MPAQDDQSMLEELAERLELDDDEASSFIGSAMRRLGYKARQIFEDDADGGNGSGGGGGDFFSARRQGKSREIPRRGGRGGRNNGGSGFAQYGS